LLFARVDFLENFMIGNTTMHKDLKGKMGLGEAKMHEIRYYVC
jgi:hypothetical protein